jgi:N12 class adenine-specific DNA methylase
LATLRALQAAHRRASPEEQRILARWSGFGAVPGVFERKREDLAGARARLAELTSADEYRDLRRTTLNAHYTHAGYVQLIWDALGQVGFSTGRVLEPGSGSGNFIGLAPDGAEMTGIERDPVTAAIAKALYPQADIRAESFADTRIRAGYFDAAVGNVPFGKFKLSDPGHNPGRRLSIHNHFIVKALALTRPGGMVALLTSRYTMDSRNPEARRRIAGLGDLVAAIRLPTNAHRQAAGTDVVTDLLIFRRREPGAPAEPDGWELAPEVNLPGGQARVNEYFTAHPEFVLGEMRVGRGARNEHDLIVAGPQDAAPGLAAALGTAVTRARESGLVMTARAEATEPARLAPQGDQIEGLIQALPDGTFTRLAVTGSDLTTLTAQPYHPPAAQARELRQLLGLRDTVLALLRAEAATPDDSGEITRLRAELNTRYGDYLARYGPVKRFTWSAAGRASAATGEKKQIKRRPPQGGFRNDPLYPLVYALEESYDPATRTAVRADIFSQRVVVPEPPLLGADTADEALAICLNTYGDVRLGEITRLLGADSDTQARTELGTLVYDEPATGRLIWAPLYLSGDVRSKLAAATDAAASDPRFEENVRALRQVIPRDLGPAEIEAQLGAGWIAPEYVQQFLRETLGDNAVTVERTRGRKWRVSGGNRGSVAATSTWGTRDICAHDLTQRLLTGTAEQILVHYKASDGSKIVDHQATEAAKQMARELADRFSIWVWEDTGRARDLSRVYNDRYNAVVPVSFDNLRLFTPGLSAALTLRKHQPPAIARIIYQGSAGLVHDTGAGKTLETIIGVRERQRLRLSHKPCFVVQKHKLGDFRDEFLRAYPGARLLVADTDDLTGDKRREFIARCATGNPAAIIMSREAFRSIPVSAERIAAFLKDEELALEQAVADAQNSGEDNRTIKQIEADLLNTRERRKEQVAKIGQDRGLCYEDTGIDYVVVDEARGYRKGPIVSSLPGMADPGSARALDLLLKLGYHKELYGETRVCLADATPFTNRISEIYTWLRYLNPDIEDFDSWVRTFGKMATAYEMTPGGDFKAKARLREIINAVDLHLWLRELNDFKLKNSLDLKLPVMTGGKPEIVQVPASDELIDYAGEIAWRYEHLPKGPPKKGEDNHLKIQGDAIKSALDLRLVGRSTSQPQKADVTADVIFGKWLKHRDDVYRREDGSEHPVRGSLILVFASLGTPGRMRKLAEDQEPGPFDQWDFYTELRTQLTDRGMPRHLIRFIHEADNAQQKEELYRACRNGEVAVLVGSTEKLGTGTNVQDRAVGLVQVTAPWNWDEPHQELGRVERQGNQNPEFFCIRVVTSPSADAIKWERARQKEHSFRALMSGRIEGRTIRIPDDDLTAAEMMAAASGEPRLLERAELEGTISRLHTLRRAWAQNQTALGYTISSAEQQIAGKNQAIAKIDAALRRRKDTRADAFAMTVDGQRFTKRADAAERLRGLLIQNIAAVPRGHIQRCVALGEIGGFTLTATLTPHYSNSITLTLEGIPDLPAPLVLNHRELPEKTGIITRLENRLSGLEQARAEAAAAIEQLTSEIEDARASIGGSFPQQDDYDQACARLDALETELAGAPKGAHDAAEPETAAAAGAGTLQRPSHGSRDHEPADPDSRDTAGRAHAAVSPQPAGEHAAAESEDGPPGSSLAREDTAHAASAPTAVTDWTSAHPLASHIDTLLRDARADSLLAATASGNGPQNFTIAFSTWLERHVAAMTRDGRHPGAMGLVKAYCDDPGFAADLTATLAAAVYSAHHGPGAPAFDPAALAAGVADAAARHWRGLAEKARRAKHGCDPASGTCPACAADPRSEDQLRLAAEIDVHMTRLGVPREGRTVAWDSQAGTYLIQCPAGKQQPAWQLMMPADRAFYAVFCGSRWADTQLHLRRGEASPAQVAGAFTAMLTAQAGPQAPAPGVPARTAGTSPQHDSGPGTDGKASEPQPVSAADLAVPRPARTPKPEPASPAKAVAAGPAQEESGGLLIEHDQQGSLVHGTDKDDLTLRGLLHEHGFRWSRTLTAWYLPRRWSFSTRDHRVTALTARLKRDRRSFTVRGQPPVPAADGSPAEPVPTGQANGEPGTQAQETPSSAAGTHAVPAATDAALGARAGQPPDAPGADRRLSRLPPGTRVHARPGRSEHEEVVTLISGPRPFSRDLPATYVGETAGGQRCTVDPARITAILGTTLPAAHSEVPSTDKTDRDTGQDQAPLPESPQDPGTGSAGNPAVAPVGDAPTDAAGSTTAAIWRAPQDAARLAAAGNCTYHLYRATGGASITRCVVSAMPPQTAAGYLSATPAGAWTETWRGQDHPLGPGAVPGPDYPITLSEARALAAAARLEVHITRAAGRAYVSLAEPGAASAPALSFEYGSREVFAGRHITTASRAITWLDTYRETTDEWAAAHGGDIFTATEAIPGWKCRIAHLVPHVPAGPDHKRAVSEHLAAAIRLARCGQHAEAEQALRRAEAASPALVLAPAREAALTDKIDSDAVGYAWTGSPARYIAEIMHATPPEWNWIDRRIAASPGISTQDPAPARQPSPTAAMAQDNTAAARDLASQAKAAYDQGRYGQALALADDAEICDPVQQHRYEQIRQVITAAAAAPPATLPADSASGPAEPQLEPRESKVHATAAQPLPGRSAPDLPELPPAPAAPGPVTGADAAPATPPNGTADETAATTGKETGARARPAVRAAPAAPPVRGPAGPPDGTQTVTAHTEWGGPLRPERLLYADGTPLTIRGQGEDGDQVLQVTAAGAAPAGSDHAPGRLQVVQYDGGRYGIVHPALACHRDIDPYTGLSDRDRDRWEAFDLAESWPTNVAGLPPRLVNVGDVLQVERRPQSRVMDLCEVQSIQPGQGPYAGGLEIKVKGRKSPLSYPDRSTVAVGIPAQHPSLAAVIRAATTLGPSQGETAASAADDAPAARPAAGEPGTATRGTAPDQDPPGAADGVHPGGQGQYSSRIRISDAPGRLTVSGTTYADDPPELREALRASGFTWRKQRKVWEYAGRDAGRQKSVTAIRELLARLDRDAASGGAKTFPPTPQQQAILDACVQGKNVAIQALAGTGKTTTLVLVARALMDRSPGTRIIYTAFNADIVADARRGRFGRNVTAMTMHSIAKQALLGTSYARKITDGGQGAHWPEQWAEVLGIPALTATGGDPVSAEAVARLVIATIRRFRESADEQPGRQHLPSHLAGAAQSPLAKAVLSYARKAWADITGTGNAALLATGRALRVDHDDYLKVWALCRPRIGADVIFFDEAQDVNAVMRQVILDQPAQTIVVGDSHQSIYGFRGAIDALKDWPADVVLPLTQSWRFGPDAAEFGNLFLQSLGSGLLLEGNPALETRLGRAGEPDAIMCRTNATAVAEVFVGLESGKRTALAGGGQAIKDIAKAAWDLQARRGTKHPDLSRFADWDEVRAYAQQGEDGKSLQVFVRLVDRHGPDGLIDMISRLTPEGDTKNPPQLTISTVHKAKGREWDAVRIAGDFRGPATDPETGDTTWPSPEERRLAYVAATRAKELLETGSLTWIYDYPQPDGRDSQGTQRTPPLQDLAASKEAQRAATPQPPPAPDTCTAATAGQPAPGPGKETPGHDAAGGSPQKPGHGRRDDAPAADDAKAGQIIAAARRRAEAGDQAHVPIDHARANAMVRHQRAALTRAVNSGDPAKVILAAQTAVSEWNQPGMAWPDDWSRWQRALDDVQPWNQRILLDDLPPMPAPDDRAPRPGDTAGQHVDATAETVTGPAHGKPASSGDPEPTAAPVNNGDLAAALHRLPGWEFARFVSGAGTPGPAGSRISRQDGEPDAGAHEALDWDNSGIDITISAPGIRRHGHVPLTQVASWIDPGMSPARLGLIITADRLSSFCRTTRDKLIAAGKPDPDDAAREFAQIRDDAISTVISAALSTRGSAAPIPPARTGQPSYQTTAMITRPNPAAGKDENTALQRLVQLRAAIREPQPASDAGIKTTIKRWIGDGLPDYVRVLGKPAAMRDWINGQVTTRASRPVHVTYDTPGIPGGRWYGASPEGLLTAEGDDDRAETLIHWEEIPAWIQPGISSECREQLLAADERHRAVIRRRLTAATGAIPGGPGGQQAENQTSRLRREAIDAAWAAIETAPVPPPAQREHARRAYQEDASPVQESLFGGTGPADRHQQQARKPAGDPAAPGQPLPAPAKPGPAGQPAGPATAPGTSDAAPSAAGQQDGPAVGSAPHTAPPAPQNEDRPAAGTADSGTGSNPLTSDDIFLSLRRLPILRLAELICAMEDGQPLDSLARYLEPYSGDRAAKEPDTGARETVTCTPQGIRVQVATGSGMRAGQLGWPEVADWLSPGLSPERLQVMRQAAQTRLRFITVSASFRAVGEADMAAGAELELRDLIGGAVRAALEAARSAAAGKPPPGGQQPPPGDDEAAALERIDHLASALPAWPPQRQKPVSQVQTGDIIGHPGYKFQPFRVSAPPRHHDGVIEITGRLTGPPEGDPAGESTWTMTTKGQADPPVHVVPVPARSLRPGTPERAEPAAGQQGLAQHSNGGPGRDDPQRQETATKDPDPPRDARRIHAHAAGDPTTGNAPSGTRTPTPGQDMGTGQPSSTTSPAGEGDTTATTPTAKPVAAPEPPAAAEPGPAQAGPAAREAAAETRCGGAPADRAGGEVRLLQELDDVLAAIFEHTRMTAHGTARVGADFADIRAAFASLRNALELPADGSQPRPGSTLPGPAAAQPLPTTATNDRPAPEADDDFGDIRAAFTDLRQALDLPTQGRHTRTPGPHPGPPEADAASDRRLDQAAAEAQACARWYRDTPEWQRITTVSRATRDLITTIRQASGEYWTEIRQDIRVRGFVRTVAARTSLAVSGAAHILAGRMAKAGHRDTRIWRAAWGLHKATATFADRVMRYTPPRSPDRMGEVRHIINDLGQRPRRSTEPGPSHATGSRSREAGTTSAVALGMEGFPLPVSPTTIRQAAAPAARVAAPSLPRQPHTERRP